MRNRLSVAVALSAWALAAVPAWAVDPTPSPSPTPVPADPATNDGIWASLNAILMYLEDVVLALLPATPEWLKLSSLVGWLHGAFPAGPWFILHDLFTAFIFVAGALVIFKAIKLFWI